MARLHKQTRFFLLTALVVSSCLPALAQTTRNQAAHSASSLAELRDKRKAFLVVFKSRVLDLSDGERAIIDDVLQADAKPKGRYRWVYNQLATKFNKYMEKYGSSTAATGLADADFVIFFNVVEFRKILDTTYPYGELFVIVKGSPEELKPPRVVWRANRIMVAGDAIGNLIKELKLVRGES